MTACKVVAISSAKGGVGKSTVTVATGSRLARLGFKVAVLDTDKAGDSARWVQDALESGAVENMTAVRETLAEQIKDRIAELKPAHELILVDLPGEFSSLMTYVMVRSDFVVLPTNCSEFDMNRLRESVSILKETADSLDKTIPYRILINNFPAGVAVDRAARELETFIEQMGYPAFGTRLMNRPALKRIINEGRPLEDLGAGNALDNLDSFIAELAREIGLPVGEVANA